MSIVWAKSERSVIDKICGSKRSLAHSLDTFLLSAFNSLEEHLFGQDSLIALNVPRRFLSLDPAQKPGDIDILLVPYDGKLLLRKIIAIEVKVIRPTLTRPNRNANSLGVTQAKGLLRDGFPYVGLLHIILPEPLPEAFHINVPMKTWKLDESGELEDAGFSVPFDPFPIICSSRQEGRIKASGLPREVSYRAVSYSVDPISQNIIGNTMGDQRVGLVNNFVSESLVSSIQALFLERPKLFQRVQWNEGQED